MQDQNGCPIVAQSAKYCSRVLLFFAEYAMINKKKGGAIMNPKAKLYFAFLRRYVVFILSLTTLFAFAACGGKEGGSSESTPQSEDTSVSELAPPSVTLAADGASSYTVIFSRNGDSLDRAMEFKNLFARATGITLPNALDTSAQADPNGYEIVIGRTDRDAMFGDDLDLLVSDAYVIRLNGNRLLICAANKQGYTRAFADFFKATLGVESIESMQPQQNAYVSLPEGYSLLAEPTLTLEENKTASGLTYTAEGQTGGAYNYLTFTDTLTYRFSAPVGESFNFYSVRYSSNAYLAAELVYTQNGRQYTEQLYLEPGDQMVFDSFCDGAVGGKSGAAITELRLTPIKSKQAEFMLADLSAASREIPAEVVYVSSGRYRLGVKLAWGGGISYLEDLEDGNEQLTNLLNDHDTGRLVQQSYYGTVSAPYTPAQYNGTTWSYNPVQGGDQYNNRSKLVDFRITEGEGSASIYVKCQPLDWAQRNMLTPSYMENTYTIENGLIRVDNRFVDFSGYNHREAHQELPAFYTVSYLSDFVYYAGQKAFSDEALTVKKDLPFWGGNDSAYFKLFSKETWGAWIGPDGYGIGVYTPIADTLLAGRFSYNGSTKSDNNATNYVAPLITYRLKTLEPFTYSYYVTTGKTEEIRGAFRTAWEASK